MMQPTAKKGTFKAPEFTLESGIKLFEVDCAYKTWGVLNETRDNVMVICHAFTGSVDVDEWWGELIGIEKAFDPSRFFIFCANVLGSPYGSTSSLSLDPVTGIPYGPAFPPTTIRDDVRLQKLVLDHLRVASVAVAVGGSMGGMAVLEWPLCIPGFVKRIIPIATCARHSAWCISWGEVQRQAIYSDPLYCGGYYDKQQPPSQGLATARSTALLTYRSRESFGSRFGRQLQHLGSTGVPTDHGASFKETTIFSAQSYLRYQGAKFISRFDANCYIHLSHKLDTHDILRQRYIPPQFRHSEALSLSWILGTGMPDNVLVIAIDTDSLYPPVEQQEIADAVPNSQFVVIPSNDGHDGFLLEWKAINNIISVFLQDCQPQPDALARM